ncbi:MAG: branched-chain amino acid ABC transporter permease, partial [Nonomuraea sp.]|nr:branched-chain amino acid ABC transporter permease [Nonomuraea sp.]
GGAYGLTVVILSGVVGQVVPAALDAAGIDGNLMLVVFGAGTVHALVTAPRGIGGQVEDLLRRPA